MHKFILFTIPMALITLWISPLDRNVQFTLWPLLFALKSMLIFIALYAISWGLGSIVLGVISKPLLKKLREAGLLFIALMGLVITGVILYIWGLFYPPSLYQALAVAGLGLMGLALHGSLFVDALNSLYISAKELWTGHSYQASTKWFFLLCLVIITAKFTSVFDLQSHEDAYLYHLSLADLWIHSGKTGLNFDNVTSGYAFAIEHFYLFLKLLLQGEAEQNAMAQIFHAILGYGSFLYVLVQLVRKNTSMVITTIFILWFMQPAFLSFALYPKNDGFVIAASAFALWSLLKNDKVMFAISCFIAGAIKVTALINLAGIGIGILLYSAISKDKDLITYFRILIIGAIAAVIGLAPFAINNYILSQNPVFPLANGIFDSSFAPISNASIVGEMQPFNLSLSSLFTSFWELVSKRVAVLWLALLAALFYLVVKILKNNLRSVIKIDSDSTRLAVIFLCVFLSLLLFLGPFHSEVHTRHYTFPIGLLTCICFVWFSKFDIALGEKASKFLVVVLAIYAIAVSNAEVAFMKLGDFFKKDQLSQSLLEEKPLMALNKTINTENLGSDDIVLVLTYSNTRYFLESGRFWHLTITSELLVGGQDFSKPESVLDLVNSNNIQRIILDKESRIFQFMKDAGFQTVDEAGNLIYIKK